MIIQQTQNAFNDKMAQFVLIPLGGAASWSSESSRAATGIALQPRVRGGTLNGELSVEG